MPPGILTQRHPIMFSKIFSDRKRTPSYVTHGVMGLKQTLSRTALYLERIKLKYTRRYETEEGFHIFGYADMSAYQR